MSKTNPSNPAKITPKNIKKFITGWYRYLVYKLFYSKQVNILGEDSKDVMFLPRYKMEQFVWRQKVMNKECLSSGHCVICGCQTPQLQMADEACEGKCYPEMMNKETWEDYKTKNNI